MSQKKRPRLTIALILLLGVLFICLLLIDRAAERMVHPERRALMDYHQTILDNPERSSLTIQSEFCLEGRVPTLILTSDGSLSAKAALLREQLQENNHPLISQAELKKPHSTIILLHGRRGRKEDLLPVAERFCAVGFRCIIPDLPAHGDSPLESCHFGTSPFERTLAKELFQEVATKGNFHNQPVHLWGMSMGGSFVCHNLNTAPKLWSSATILCSFDKLDNVTRGQAGHFISAILSQRIQAKGGTRPEEVQPIIEAKKAQLPVFIAHADNDELISEEIGKRLFDAFPSDDKAFLAVPGGGHDRILTTPMKLYAAMAAFMLEHP